MASVWTADHFQGRLNLFLVEMVCKCSVYQAKMQELLTLQVSCYCLLALHGIAVVHTKFE